jgi:HEAT repeat protein
MDIAHLIRDLKSANPATRAAAAARLMEMGQPAVLPLCEALAGQRIGPTALSGPEVWLARLASPNDFVRKDAEGHLVQLGGRAVPGLARHLVSADPFLRDRAARILRQIDQAPPLPPSDATALLNDGSPHVREAAVRALRTAGRFAVPALCSALKDADAFVRQLAAAKLGEIGDADAVEPLSEALLNADGQTGPVIAHALGRIGGETAVRALRRALESTDQTTRLAAAFALAEIAGRDATPQVRACLPLLRKLMRSDLMARGRYGQAIARIEAVTRHLPPAPNLPIPAGPADFAGDALPRPSASASHE